MKPLLIKEKRSEYANKWVYTVDCDFDIGVPMKTGIPMILADSPWEGSEDGIYEELDNKYERTTYLSFLTNELNVFGISEVAVNV